MAKEKDPLLYLPLSESTFYILLALYEPMHGYGVMQKTEEISAGAVKIGPGTLYGAFSTLLKEGLIWKVREEDRRKVYELTDKGRAVCRAQLERYELMLRYGQEVIDNNSLGGEE
ncbi:MAG: helix-turn-helix transcriptional regulator [Anaerolineales bacterium]|nr:helix-turn-helix transcriptional regulator [Anaerolineales bacterium]